MPRNHRKIPTPRYPVRIDSRQFPDLLQSLPPGLSRVTAEGCYSPEEFTRHFPGLELKDCLSAENELSPYQTLSIADATIGPASALVFLYREFYNQTVTPEHSINAIAAADRVYPVSQLPLSVLQTLLQIQSRFHEDFTLAVEVFGSGAEEALEYAAELGLSLSQLGPPPAASQLAIAA